MALCLRGVHKIRGTSCGFEQVWCLPGLALVLLAATTLSAFDVSRADNESWRKYEALGNEARQTGDFARAEESYANALELIGQSQQISNDTATLLNKIGEIHFRKKDYKKAEAAYRRALSIFEWNKGPDDHTVAETLDLLATSFLNQVNGKAVAGALYYRALAIREKALGPEHPLVADSLHNVGLTLYFDQGRLPTAIPLFRRALAIREKAFGHSHLKVAESLSSLAFVYDLHGSYKDAASLYEEALEIRETNLGPDAPEVLQTLYNLGMAYRLQGEYGKAETINKRRLMSLERKLGPDHPEVAAALEIYASTLRNAGREEEAKILHERAEQIRAKAKGRTVP